MRKILLSQLQAEEMGFYEKFIV